MSKSWYLRSQKFSQDNDFDRNRFPAAQSVSDRDDLPECVGCVDRDNQICNLNESIINLNTQNQNFD